MSAVGSQQSAVYSVQFTVYRFWMGFTHTRIVRHKAQVGADTIRPKEKAQQLVGEGLRALPKKTKPVRYSHHTIL